MDKITDETGSSSRITIFKTTIEAVKDFGIFGSGPGSFPEIYQLYENRETVRGVFIPQAHNDFLQLILELGVFGFIIEIVGIYWFLRFGFFIFKKKLNCPKLQRIFLLSCITPLLHSLVDYPLRNIGVSVIFVFFILLSISRDKSVFEF